MNLVDTPGHPDFIAEVDRSLAVLDAAILVVSAVEGVQAQTVVLYRALRRLNIPAVFLVNKIDRVGADPDRILHAIRRRLTGDVLPLGRVVDQGTAGAAFSPASWNDLGVANDVTAHLADRDDELLTEWVAHSEPPPQSQLWQTLGKLTRRVSTHPLLFGSARTGAGVPELIGALTDLLPPDPGVTGLTPSGQIFAMGRTPAGHRVCSVRMRGGKLAVRDRLVLGPGRVGTVTALDVYEPGGTVQGQQAVAGQVARVHGLTAARIGDGFGPLARLESVRSFPRPAFQTSITALDPERSSDLHRALLDLADVDPLIRLRPDHHEGVVQISVYGEVQQEVIAETLAEDYGIGVAFRDTTVICVEQPAGRASALRSMGDPGHPYGFTLGLTVEPIPLGTGVELEVTADRVSLPLHVYGNVEGFKTALLGYLATPLAVGPQGWKVTDVRVTVTDSDYPSAGPSAAEVRNTVALVISEAVSRAGTVVCEPVDRFQIETPDGTVSNVLGVLARHRGVPEALETARGITVVTGSVPTADTRAVRTGLHTAAHGEAVMESALDHFAPIRAR